MRAFLAIDLPEEMRERLAALQASLQQMIAQEARARDDVRWVAGIHLTLKFLGEISPEQLKRVVRQLQSFDPFEAFTVEIKGLGFFPDARRPRVLWAGVEAEAGLPELAARVEATMAEIGFAPEQRRFQPHLTLARFKGPPSGPALRNVVREGMKTCLGRFQVSDFYLFESILTAGSGARYEKIGRFPAT